MTIKEIIEVLIIERNCVERQDTPLCDRNCANCDLVMPTGRVVKAYEQAIDILHQEPCEDAISRDMALEKMADYVASGYADSAEDFEEYSRIICQLPSVTQKSGKWIALVTRPMTNEEREYYSEQLDYCDGDAVIYNCPLPEEGQDVLITTCTGAVLIDTFFNDYDGCGFEGYDIEDVKAWMPLPKPYEPQESEEQTE